MTNLTIGTLFSGGGGVDIGAMTAGLQPAWAVEYDAAIADVYRRNIGDHVTVADILALDPLDFEPVDVLHASPPCPNFSNAKAGAQETDNDIALGRKVAEFVEALCPSIFSLENVYGYRKAKSFRIIVKALRRLGYHVRWWHLNSADYGGLVSCPIHTSVNSAGSNLVKETAQDIVEAVAMTNGDAARKSHARAVAALLVRAIQPAFAAGAVWPALVNGGNLEKLTPAGKGAVSLMSAAMSRSGTVEDTCENIGSWLRECWGDHLLTERWFTTSTEIRLTTTRLIYESLRTIPGILPTITGSMTSPMAGVLARNGHNCPLCQYTAVPQTRKRLILVARQDREPRRPEATHRDPAAIVAGQLSLFGDALPPWVGWYAAIEDLIPSLPESRFADWQLARLPEEMRDMLVGGQWAGHLPTAAADEPADTVVSTLHSKAAMPKAFIVGQNQSADQNGEDYGELTRRSPDEPALTVTGNHNMTGVRAFIADGKLNDNSTSLTTRDGDARSVTVTTSHNNRDVRAFIVSNAATEWSDGVFDGDGPALSVTPQTSGRARAFVLSSHTVDGTDVAARDEGEPVTTVDGKANGQVKAFVVDHQNVSRDATTRNGDEPFITVQAEQMRRPSSTSTVFVYRDEYSEWDDDDLRDFVENSDDEDFEAWKWWITERNTDRPRYRAIGRVVQMTPRALARFQSFPDSYWLPDSKTLSCRIIGNAVPPLLYQRVMEAQL